MIRTLGADNNALAGIWSGAALADDLRAFVAELRRIPEFSPLLGEDDPAIAAQLGHWQALLSGPAGAGEATAEGRRAALPAAVRTAAYGWLLMRLVPRLSARHRFSKRGLDRAMTALLARVFGDMILATAATEAETIAVHTGAFATESDLGNLRNLAGTVADVNNVAFDLAHLSRNTRHLSSGAQTIASAAAELVASVEDISRNSEGAAKDAAETNETVQTGRAAVDQLSTAISHIAATVEETARSVDELSAASEQIGQILTVIEGIAGQTNLLALNATIEAARAGEAGRGFAVVAAEVKNLANQTAKSTEDIARRIVSLREGMGAILSTMARSKTAVAEGETAIAKAADTMGVVADQVGSVSTRMQGISDILHQQKGATAEIAASIDKVADIAGDTQGLLGSMATHLGSGNARFADNAKAWFKPTSHRSLVEMAKIDHVLFKKRIMEVLMGRDAWRSTEVPDHHNCRLGKWYDAISTAEIKALPAYAALVAPHQRVHAAGRRALAAYESGDLDTALSALGEMNAASADVLKVLEDMAQALNTGLVHLDQPARRAADAAFAAALTRPIASRAAAGPTAAAPLKRFDACCGHAG
ncbi:methyl-accepting chemotaxis protein [Blastochloris viridis]|uniref:Methyl-accepting chemotaxis protein n=1 Tax=Blastochloris viridis TaxID=1079 RepID=A0A0H5BBW9_BLAVI|nr:methyl-accepting chemotaxis protein [Blastochloris viridis]CUU43032.1 Methyl-accepting chemotaxis protein 4 [Blastochloris viridis]